jgi:hypothetical protein
VGGGRRLSVVYQGAVVALTQPDDVDVEDVVVAFCSGLGLGGTLTAQCIRAILPQVIPEEL